MMILIFEILMKMSLKYPKVDYQEYISQCAEQKNKTDFSRTFKDTYFQII